MKIPGLALSTPACHDPSVLVTRPRPSSSAVRSPKYQTLPAASCVYQSVVRSARRPSRYRRSRTTRHGAPAIVVVCRVTVTMSRARLPSLTPVNTAIVPGTRGNHGLSTLALKRGGTVLVPPCPHAVDPAAAPTAARSTTTTAANLASTELSFPCLGKPP